MKSLTPKQKLIYDFVRQYIDASHVPPSLREIGAHFDLSVGTIQDQVEALHRKGYLQKEETKARALRLPVQANHVPILGRIHAGPLHAALENVEGQLPVGNKCSSESHFALRVRGDSMIEAGILEGDMVIVHSQVTAEDGDIVVARIEEEATVKRLRKKGHQIFLEPANSRYKPIKDILFEIVGVVVEVRRHYK